MNRKTGDVTVEIGILFLTILVVIIVFLAVSPQLSGDDSGPKTPYDHIIKIISSEYRIESSLLKAMMKVSSDFNPSLSGDRIGLMAITDNIIKDLKGGDSSTHCDKMEVKDPKDPEQNIKAGTCYFSYLLDRYDNNKLHALVAYHWNPSGFDNSGKDMEKAPDQSRSYANNVIGFYNEYSKNVGWDFE